MSPSQKDDDGQEWVDDGEYVYASVMDDHNGNSMTPEEIATRYNILHRDVRHLRERVRVLEEALREIDAEFDDGADPKTMRRLLDAVLLSPAAATEGGEGA